MPVASGGSRSVKAVQMEPEKLQKKDKQIVLSLE